MDISENHVIVCRNIDEVLLIGKLIESVGGRDLSRSILISFVNFESSIEGPNYIYKKQNDFQCYNLKNISTMRNQFAGLTYCAKSTYVILEASDFIDENIKLKIELQNLIETL